MALGTILTIGSLLASLIGGGVKAYKEKKYADEVEDKAKDQEELARKQGLRSAMARALGVDVEPYQSKTVEMPDRPSTTWGDILQGLGSAGSQIGAMQMAKEQYPLKANNSKSVDYRDRSQYGV